MDDFYAILGLTSEATNGEISKAYRDLARKYHPDSTQEEDVQAAIARFKEVVQAYEVLNDKAKKADYDRKYVKPSKTSKKGKQKPQKAKKDPNVGNVTVPEAPKRDIWGRPLTEAEKRAWVREASTDMFGSTYPIWGKVSNRTNDFWFKDIFAKEYGNVTPPPPPKPRPKWREEACEKFVDVWEAQYSKPPKKEEHEEPYSEEFYKRYGVENF
jgi:DnaJ-class molecular chaperone